MLKAILYISALSALLGCGKPEEAAAPAEKVSSKDETPENSVAPGLAQVHESLKAGSYDDAAARLLELQSSGRSFSAREAADYRRSMNDAYTRALEAAERGDKRAEAAIQMIRAASAH